MLEKHQDVTRKLIDAGEKADEAQKAEARELLDRATELEREVAAIRTTQERDLKLRVVEERRRILESIGTVIEKFNADATYAMVLDRSAASANGIPPIYYFFCTVYYILRETGFTEVRGFDMTPDTRLKGREFARSFARAVRMEGTGRLARPGPRGEKYIDWGRTTPWGRWRSSARRAAMWRCAGSSP